MNIKCATGVQSWNTPINATKYYRYYAKLHVKLIYIQSNSLKKGLSEPKVLLLKIIIRHKQLSSVKLAEIASLSYPAATTYE